MEPAREGSRPAGGMEALDALVSRVGTRRAPALGRIRWVPIVSCLVVLAAGAGAWRWVGRPVPLEDRIAVATTVHAADAGADGEAARGASTQAADSSGRPATMDAGGTSSGRDAQGAAAANSAESELVVHVVGAVLAPGVVRVSEGARVIQAVVAAGGLAPGADTQRVNLAAPVVDGSRIVVPAVGQPVPPEVPTSVATPPPGASATGGGTDGGGTAAVDINSATADQLDALPGIGPATAEAILAHREANGPFESVEDLLEVRGIGDAKLEALRDLVVVVG